MASNAARSSCQDAASAQAAASDSSVRFTRCLCGHVSTRVHFVQCCAHRPVGAASMLAWRWRSGEARASSRSGQQCTLHAVPRLTPRRDEATATAAPNLGPRAVATSPPETLQSVVTREVLHRCDIARTDFAFKGASSRVDAAPGAYRQRGEVRRVYVVLEALARAMRADLLRPGPQLAIVRCFAPGHAPRRSCALQIARAAACNRVLPICAECAAPAAP